MSVLLTLLLTVGILTDDGSFQPKEDQLYQMDLSFETMEECTSYANENREGIIFYTNIVYMPEPIFVHQAICVYEDSLPDLIRDLEMQTFSNQGTPT